ncbi:MAG: hypothetical protein MZU97_10310 [Bacillus subtilis]|nr:hypothetical protein [Bacillus subtilis]
MEKAILVGLETKKSVEFDYRFTKELAALAEACNLQVLETVTQCRQSIGPTAAIHRIRQSRRTERRRRGPRSRTSSFSTMNCRRPKSAIWKRESSRKVIDRTILILDIFAKRARTKEAMLQVELCPEPVHASAYGWHVFNAGRFRAVRRDCDSKGPGENEIRNNDKRMLRDKISHIQEELKEIVSVRRTQREKRKKDQVATVALAGYTNSGQIHNTEQDAGVLLAGTAKNTFSRRICFSLTLETATRSIALQNKHQFLVYRYGRIYL